MKTNYLKAAFAAVCVVAAGFGSVKAYNAANQSETDLLLAENVEALSQGDDDARAICNSHCTYNSGTNCGFILGSAYWICTNMKKEL